MIAARTRSRLCAALAALLIGPAATEPTHAQGPTGADSMPLPPVGPVSLAPKLVLDDKRLVLSWLDREADRHALRFSAFDGARWSPAGEVAAGADWFANWADTPSIHVASDGGWIAHWLQKSGPSTYAYDIRVSTSEDRGQSWSPPRTLHRDGTQSEHGFVSYFNHAGATSLVWLDGRETAAGGPMTLRTAGLKKNGETASSTLLDARVCDCCSTAAAVTDQGPVVVYRDRSETEIRDIRLVRLDGDAWSDPVTVHDDGWQISGCPVNGPDVIASGPRVVVAWFTMAENLPAVRVAVSEDAGRSFTRPVTLSPGQALGRVRLAWHGDEFLLGWMAGGPNGGASGAEYHIARFAGDGRLLASRPVTALSAQRISGFPQMAVFQDTLILAWTGSTKSAAGGRAPRVRVSRIALESILHPVGLTFGADRGLIRGLRFSRNPA